MMPTPVVDAEPVSASQARAAWQTGVAPLLEAFPDHAGDILRAIAFAHRAPFPVPVFITGRAGAGKTTLARTIGELTGRSATLELPQRSLASIRKAATPGEPLVLDDAAPAHSRARPAMFTQIQAEVYASRNSPLNAASIVVATGEQKIDELSLQRTLATRINRRRAPGKVYEQLHSAAAAAARLSVHTFLQAQIPRVTLSRADSAATRLALGVDIEHERRRDAALHVGGVLLRALELDAGTSRHRMPREDSILVGVYAALQYVLDNGALLGGRATAGDWILGRRDEDYLYVIPGELMPFIRAELNDTTLTSNAVAAALENRGVLYPSRRQGRSIPRSINGTLTRVWRLSPGLLI
ncbi:hypothetical protein ACLQ2Q_20350 [Microbacterium sp. DT81.1]|uniref:hypothetical protein n=1 Tax=Microbacterium sp. DT81.1 TaxID=3393413 RepID=UPI003CF89D34